MKSVSIGILIIGSLLWDNSRRQAWRDSRLEMLRKRPVFVGTRYGRRSRSRKDTYTLVFSSSAKPSTAYVVPCKARIENLNGLVTEAQALAEAEGLGSGDKRADFGAVGLLLRPGSSDDGEILRGWSSYFKDQLNGDCGVTSVCASGERPSLTEDGLLNVAWPIDCENDKPNGCDLLIATANAPHLDSRGNYPTAEQIAGACVDARYARYFRDNVKAGNRTDDDFAIWKHLRTACTSWTDWSDYRVLDELLAIER